MSSTNWNKIKLPLQPCHFIDPCPFIRQIRVSYQSSKKYCYTAQLKYASCISLKSLIVVIWNMWLIRKSLFFNTWLTQKSLLFQTNTRWSTGVSRAIGRCLTRDRQSVSRVIDRVSHACATGCRTRVIDRVSHAWSTGVARVCDRMPIARLLW